MEKCLVLGAAGFIGSNLCRELAKKYQVRAFDLCGLEELSYVDNIEVVYGDFVQMPDYMELLKGIDTVYFLICTTIPKDDTFQVSEEIEMNLIPLTRLLESVVKSHIDNFVFISSAGTVYGEGENDDKKREQDSLSPVCSYGVLKQVCEAYIQFYNNRYGKKYRIARVTNPYGWGQNKKKRQGIIPIFINRLLKGQEITVYGNGENVRDYIYMPDLIDALIHIGEYLGDISVFNVGYGKGYSTNQIIDIIESIADMKFNTICYSEKRFCDVMINDVDSSLLQNELKWRAKISLEEGILELLNYYRELE